jgi:hypothetical protein
VSEIPALEWRALVYDDRVDYDVGSDGTVRSAGHRLITPHKRGDGHLWVNLEGKGRFRGYKLAFLVALTFHGERPSPKHVLGFRDHDRQNTRADNVYWVLSAEYPRRVKLPPTARAAIRASSDPATDLAKRYGVTLRTVTKLRNGETWATDGEAA